MQMICQTVVDALAKKVVANVVWLMNKGLKKCKYCGIKFMGIGRRGSMCTITCAWASLENKNKNKNKK